MPEEFDDFGIPIKKQSVASENDTHDEFGIPVKKKRIKRKKRTFYQRLKDSFSAFRKEWRR